MKMMVLLSIIILGAACTKSNRKSAVQNNAATTQGEKPVPENTYLGTYKDLSFDQLMDNMEKVDAKRADLVGKSESIGAKLAEYQKKSVVLAKQVKINEADVNSMEKTLQEKSALVQNIQSRLDSSALSGPIEGVRLENELNSAKEQQANYKAHANSANQKLKETQESIASNSSKLAQTETVAKAVAKEMVDVNYQIAAMEAEIATRPSLKSGFFKSESGSIVYVTPRQGIFTVSTSVAGGGFDKKDVMISQTGSIEVDKGYMLTCGTNEVAERVTYAKIKDGSAGTLNGVDFVQLDKPAKNLVEVAETIKAGESRTVGSSSHTLETEALAKCIDNETGAR